MKLHINDSQKGHFMVYGKPDEYKVIRDTIHELLMRGWLQIEIDRTEYSVIVNGTWDVSKWNEEEFKLDFEYFHERVLRGKYSE